MANHPFGVIDPVMLARWVGQFRPDMKVMTNSMLLAMEELAREDSVFLELADLRCHRYIPLKSRTVTTPVVPVANAGPVGSR